MAVPDGSGTLEVVGVPSWSLSVPILLADKNDIVMFLETDLFQEVVSRPASVHVTLQNYRYFCFVFTSTSRKTPHAPDPATWLRESALTRCSGHRKHYVCFYVKSL